MKYNKGLAAKGKVIAVVVVVVVVVIVLEEVVVSKGRNTYI
jgi:hypothetical protein